ncbi:MAG TPA: carboxypeptidase regulatory-like domain-containing protein [Solirubrobacteraceae bacterium]|nr:carboxypeptidase regulatory-like domain-containing protein [Solirubrobacteraceae bacterium]
MHEARHTCASILIAAGVNAKALSVIMGHSTIAMTFDTYGHLMPGGLDEVAAAAATNASKHGPSSSDRRAGAIRTFGVRSRACRVSDGQNGARATGGNMAGLGFKARGWLREVVRAPRGRGLGLVAEDRSFAFPARGVSAMVMAVVCLAILSAASSAVASTGGAISGTVISAASKEVIAGIEVCAYESSVPYAEGCKRTSSSGEYTINELPAGSYSVSFFTPEGSGLNYIPQSYAKAVSIAAGVTTPHIDAALNVGAEVIGKIVAEGSSAAIAGISVCATAVGELAELEGFFGICATTNTSGEYALSGLASGEYKVQFTPPYRSGLNYIGQYYKGKASFAEADVLHLSAGATTTGIGATLAPGGEISGRATSATTKTAIAGLEVCASAITGEGYSCTLTEASGAYTVPGLPNGSYRILFLAPEGSALNYLSQYYNSTTSENEADPVSVKVGAVTPNIEAAMQPGGQITGKVIGAPSKGALTNAQVCASGSSAYRCATTSSSGEYAITALPSGSYTVQFLATGEYARQYYTEKVSSSEAQSVSVTAGSGTPGIDAELQPGGKITGTVTSAATSSPLEGVSVCRYAIHEEFFGSCTTTNAQGEYTFTGLAATEYKLAFSSYSSDYLTQYYHGKGSLAEAEPIAVGVGETKPGINAAMQVGGEIEGTVTSAASKLPVSGAIVTAYSSTGSYVANTRTNAKGEYTLPRLATGTYKVGFNATEQNLIAEYYEQKGSLGEATGISVTVGATTTGINAVLQTGGAISGKVTNGSTKAPFSGVNLEVATASGEFVASGLTNAAGEYKVSGLREGAYKVSFFVSGFESQYYNGKSGFSEATAVAVTAGVVAEGINAVMQSLGSISGTVTDGTTHKAVGGVEVCEYQQSNNLFGSCTSTNASGEYTIAGLVAGSYEIGFYPGSPEYLQQVYDGKASLAEATAISVASGAAVSGIDAALQTPGHVKGTVTSKASSLPLAGIEVCAEPTTGSVSGNCTTTAVNGTYDVADLQTANYRVEFFPPEGNNYLRQFYNDKGKQSEANPVAVVAGAATEGINAALVEGGEIHGTIKTVITKAPLAHAGACAYSSEVETYQCGYTNSSGEYTIASLAAAKYVVYFFPTEGEYSIQYYNGVASESEATKVTVTTGATTTNIDGQLHAAGRISGIVTSAATSKPLAGIEACAYTGAEVLQSCTTTGASGEYVLIGLTAGKHKVEFRTSSQSYETQWYKGKLLSSEAILVEVGEEATTGEINAAMIELGEIAGRVTTEGGVTGISGIQVCADGVSNFLVGHCTNTAANGEYTLAKLPGGTYKVSFYAPPGLNYIQQYYHEKSGYSEAETVTVSPGMATGSINAAMHVGGEITGKVVAAKTTTGIAGIEVCPYLVSTGGTAVGCAMTNATSEYTIEKLPTGEYKVGFADPYNSSLNYIRQYYSGHAHPSEALPLSVTAGATTGGINAALEAGGEVSGKVTRIGTKAPIQGITVCPLSHEGFEEPGPCVLTNTNGEYTLRGLPAGLVDVEFVSYLNEYVTQYYKESSEVDFATAVPVEVLHVTTNINARLKSTHPIVPELVSPPTISGTAQQSAPLTEHHGGWMNEPTEYRYQWLSCNSLGLSCLPIAHAENQVYTPVAQDVGARLEVQEIAINLEGESQPALSEPTAVVVPAKPVNLTPPSITGSARSGQTLSETHGSWSNEPTSYTYQWERCDKSGENCIFPASSTEQTYKLGSADVGHDIRVIETAINAGGESGPAVSSQSAVVVPEVPASVSPPSIAGSAAQGMELSESHGTWTNEPTSYSYQWERCSSAGTECVAIAQATNSSYRLTQADVGHKLVVAETASNAGGASKPAVSGPTALVVAAAPVDTSPPTITGFAREGATLSGVHGSWTNEPTSYSYQWLRCTSAGKECKPIFGATEQSYTLEEADVGHELVVEEVAANEAGPGAGAFSTQTVVVVAAAPVSTSPPTISGTPLQGETLKESHGTWTNSPTSYDVQWQRCDSAGENCATVTGSSEDTEYLLTAEDLGHTIRAVETASNTGGPGNPTRSAPTARVVAAVPDNTVPPTISGHTVQNETLTEVHGAWTNEPSSYEYQWERCSAGGTECAPIGGASAPTYVLTSADVGHKLVVVETANNAGGASKPQASAATAIIGPPVPVNTTPPKISGTASVGSTLTEEHGGWTNSPTSYSYQWERCNSVGFGCQPIKGASRQTYVPEAADLGFTLVVQEIAGNITGPSSPAVSSPVGPVTLPPPVNTTPPTITGSSESGQTLLVTHGGWTNNPTEYREQWLRCDAGGGSCTPIHDAINPTYASAAADIGHTLRVQETASDAGGPGEPANSQPTSLISAAPLHANAGEDIETTTGTAVTLDGSGSTPANEINGYHWDYGDGSSGEGEITDHGYASPGKYTATLTVERGSETSKQAIVVTVIAPPEHQVTVTALDEGKHPLEGVEVLYNGPGGGGIPATTNAAGQAKLANLPDGTDGVDLYKEGYKPTVGQVSVSGGGGEATVTLSSGPVGEAHLKAHPMTLKEIEEAGINVNEPGNQNVYSFEIDLKFGPLTCHVNSAGEFVGLESCSGGGGGGFTWSATGGYGGGIGISGESIKGHPIIQTLILHGNVTVLKQFFSVSMIVNNLSPEPFKFTHGQATLTVPDGMSLAPTPTPQNQTQTVADIPGDGSAEANWILRGDTPGEYYLSASYHGQLEPFEAPVELQAATNQPLKVWGAEALGFHVQADSGSLHEGVPYHVKIGIVNKANIPLYNVAIDVNGSLGEHFIYQPDQQFAASVSELKPGEIVYAPQDILVPDGNSGTFEPEKSSARFVGETVHPGQGIEAVKPPPLHKIAAPATTPGYVHLEWEATPGATGYEVFATPNLDTPFAEEPNEVLTSPLSKTPVKVLPANATTAYVPSSGKPLFYAVTSIVGGGAYLDHTVIKAEAAAEETKQRPFEVTFDKHSFTSALPTAAVATYTWKPGSKTVDWWKTARSGTKLGARLEEQAPLSFGAATLAPRTINVNTSPSSGAQTIDGFGGALTNSSAYLIEHSPQKSTILSDLYSPAGADFNLVRLPLGASDFVARPFPKEGCSPLWPECYEPNPLCFTSKLTGELQEGECFGSYADKKGPEQDPLEHFSIANDERDTIPVLDAAKADAPNLKILATPWSAPGWMKVSSQYLSNCKSRAGFLSRNSEVIDAHYLALAAKRYEEKGLPFSILSIQNEPQACNAHYPTMELEPKEEAGVANSLYSQLRSRTIGVTRPPKLLGWDHNWVECKKKGPAKYPAELLKLAPKSIALIGYHSYCGGLPYKPSFPTSAGFYVTESTGFYEKQELKEQAEHQHLEGDSGANLNYEVQHELIDPIRDGAKASLYWNLALDEGCGPQFGGGEICKKALPGGCGNCRPAITLNDERGTVTLNEDYYYWAQFSKFVRPEARYLGSTPSAGSLDSAAFKNPDGSIVVVVLNK